MYADASLFTKIIKISPCVSKLLLAKIGAFLLRQCIVQCTVQSNTFHIRPLVAVTAVPVFIYVCASESTELWRYINLSIIIIYYIGYNHYQLIHLCLFSSCDKLAATFPFIHVFCPEDSSQTSCFASFSSRFSEGTRSMLADEVERGSVLIVRQLMTSYCASHS